MGQGKQRTVWAWTKSHAGLAVNVKANPAILDTVIVRLEQM